MIGNGNANAIFAKTGTLGETLMPCLAINYSIKPQDGELPTLRKSKATLTLTGGGSALVVLVTIVNYDQTGTATTNYTYTITGANAKVAWSTTAPTYTAQALHLKDVVDLLNEIPGVSAYVLHAPHSLDVGCAFWNTTAVQDIPTQPAEYLETCYRTIATNIIDTDHEAFFMRIGNPEARDSGSLRLIGLDVLATGTVPRVRLYRDDIRNFDAEYNADYATEIANKQLYIDTTVVGATQTAVVAHDLTNALTYQCPWLLEISQSDLTACVATIKMQQASI